MLVGRDRELDAIGAAIDRATRGERAAVMFTGEPGIGKSRLLDELAERTNSLGGLAVWGRSAEVGMTPAFWPWMQVLAALETPDVRAPELATLDQPAVATSRLVRFEQVVQFVRARAAAVPIVALLFDDAHAADLASLQLLEYALPRLAGRVVVAIATRDGDATHAVQSVLGRIQRAARRLPLSRLGRDDVTTLVGERIPSVAVAKVWELTEGNPLFVEELVGALADGGTVQLPTVSSVRAIIRERIEQMPAEASAMLTAAALVGREFRAAVVADILGISDGDAIARLAPALRLGMVALVTGDRYRFSHALIAEALADELERSECAGLHLRAAQAIERRDGGTASQENSSAVAHHLLAAGHLAAGAAVSAAERAAAGAMARLAFEDAASLLERATGALVLAAPGDRARRANLECRWAEALQQAGEHARAAELCETAIRLAKEIGDVELLARIAVVRGLEYRFGRTDPLLVAVLRDALAALGTEPSPTRTPLRAKLLARLAAAEQPSTNPDQPVAMALAAIELARGIPDLDRLDVSHTACAALIEYLPAEQLELILRDTLALATAADNRVVVVHTMVRLCFMALERLDRAAFEQQRLELRPRVQALGIARWVRTLHLIDGAAALLDGRFTDAERAADAAELAAGSDVDGRFLVDLHRMIATVTREIPCGPELRDVAASYQIARAVFACWLTAEDGNLEATRAALELTHGLPTDPELAILMANAVALVGTDVQRAELYAMMSSRRHRVFFTTMVGTAVIDLHDRAALVLAASLGRWDDIERHADDALATAERLGSPVWATRIRADFATALERRARETVSGARSGDRERAAELRARALADAERFGMVRIAERCRAASVPAPTVPATTPARATPIPVTGLELARAGELWIVSGYGEQAHLKDSRGIQILARLLGHPNQDIHVLDLSGSGGPVDGGDSGEVLDATARAAYRDRLRELAAAREEAESWGDNARLERINTEMEALTDELERAVGLGNRERRQGSASERARSNVQRRLHHAFQQVKAGCPRIAEHLAATVRTGTYCRYEPT